MKQKLIILALLLSVNFIFAADSNSYLERNKATSPNDSVSENLFIYDSQKIDSYFSELDNLESYIVENNDFTLSNLQAQESQLIENISDNYSFNPNSANGNTPPYGIPSFLWGCVLGWMGVAAVYFLLEDEPTQKEETVKAVWGLITAVVATLVGFFIYVAFVLYFTLSI